MDNNAFTMTEAAPLLRIAGLHKSFHAVKATNGVNLTVNCGEIHAIIGPNGAGKSTLITQICGEILPDAGCIELEGQDITRLPPYRRARMGLGRSFQITELCQEFSALENVVLSVMLLRSRGLNIWRDPRRETELRERAMSWLEKVGLAERAGARTSDLAHGEKRQLELAVALAREPRLLLLDEPMAGMGGDESARMTRLLAEIKHDYGILLVEHDMDAVFALADRVSVLVYGHIIHTGEPAAVRQHPDVRAAYLGEQAC